MLVRALRRRRWRTATAAVTAGFVLAGAVTAAVSAPAPSASQHAVVSGDARFEVLSPALIRTEYAGNGVFEDEPTFNAAAWTARTARS